MPDHTRSAPPSAVVAAPGLGSWRRRRGPAWAPRACAALAAMCLASCSARPRADAVPPHDSFVLDSRWLAEARRINVYVPAAYRSEARRFPVLYMPDGGVAEDFPHIVDTVAALIGTGELAPVLVVGIENTQRRRDLTGQTRVAADREIAPVVGGAAAFRRFVAEELVPEVERRYRCTGQRAIVGESLAGLFVLETFFLAPGLFERSIAVSPSLWWDDHELVRRAGELLPAAAARPRTLWFTAADEDDIHPHTAALAAVLRAAAPPQLRWTYAPMPEERHDSIFRASKAAAFRAALWPPR